MVDKLLRRSAVERMIGVSRATFWRLRRTGAFPPGVRIAVGVEAWKLSTVQDWIASREAA